MLFQGSQDFKTESCEFFHSRVHNLIQLFLFVDRMINIQSEMKSFSRKYVISKDVVFPFIRCILLSFVDPAQIK